MPDAGGYSDSPLVAFYRGVGKDNRGRSIQQVWAFTDDQLEAIHDYIQWLFPLPEPSQFNPDAPTLSPPDIAAFRQEADLRQALLRSLKQMLGFYGLELTGSSPAPIIRPSSVLGKQAQWLTPSNHNFLRLTRIMRCLTVLGLPDYAVALLNRLETINRSHSAVIGHRTLAFWRDAVEPEG